MVQNVGIGSAFAASRQGYLIPVVGILSFACAVISRLTISRQVKI